jgi:UDPglucose 6-dehydrogenase
MPSGNLKGADYVNIGFVGLGKLGFPSCLAFAAAGHTMYGYDVADDYLGYLSGEKKLNEAQFEEVLAQSANNFISTSSIQEVVSNSEVVYIAVQTPHSPMYGGETPAPDSRQDFEYGFLAQAVRDVCAAAQRLRRHITVAVVSTALPGSFNKYLRSVFNEYTNVVYNPFFIAMGTTILDVRNPEFVLIGADNPAHANPLREIYATLHNKPLQVMSIESAELTKVAYNTFISSKIVFANLIMEICQKTGADCDSVIDALSLATDRIISPAYMRGGMGDSGACHPRDLIAMSWLAERLDLSTDFMGYLVRAREDQNSWLADLARHWSDLTGLGITILGRSYKPESSILSGSCGLLLLDDLARTHAVGSVDPHTGDELPDFVEPSVFVIATKHKIWQDIKFAPRSVVVDPFGYLSDQEGVTVVRVGRKS